MVKIFLLLLPHFVFAASMAPTPFPVFLKMGFSSILEFEEPPAKVVLGDPQLFQVEKLNNSIAIKTLAPYATSNMFVYFKNNAPKLFILTASEDAEPTYYKKFASLIPKPAPVIHATRLKRELRVITAKFDNKKDYLTVEIQLSADSTGVIKPQWNLVRLMSKQKAIEPQQLWSERKEVQKDSKVKARFIFNKPNLERDLSGVSIVVPVLGSTKAMNANLKRVSR